MKSLLEQSVHHRKLSGINKPVFLDFTERKFPKLLDAVNKEKSQFQCSFSALEIVLTRSVGGQRPDRENGAALGLCTMNSNYIRK